MDNFLLLPRALAAALSDTAFAGAFGLVIVSFWLQGDIERARVRRGAILSAFAMLLALSAQAYLLTATMTGSSVFQEVRGQFVAVVGGTHVGHTLIYSAVFSLALLLLLIVRAGSQTRIKTWLLLLLLVVIAALKSTNGHAASDGDFTLPVAVQLVHLLSIAMWAGCVIASGFVVLPAMLPRQNSEEICVFARRLSNTVTPALFLVVLTGIYNSYRGLGGAVAPLAHTQWGGLLDVKVVLVIAAVAMGAFSRRLLQRNPSLSPPQLSRLAAALRVEAITMLLILTVSAWLANSPPASSL
jgi:putative copper resistance protein D